MMCKNNQKSKKGLRKLCYTKLYTVQAERRIYFHCLIFLESLKRKEMFHVKLGRQCPGGMAFSTRRHALNAEHNIRSNKKQKRRYRIGRNLVLSDRYHQQEEGGRHPEKKKEKKILRHSCSLFVQCFKTQLLCSLN